MLSGAVERWLTGGFGEDVVFPWFSLGFIGGFSRFLLFLLMIFLQEFVSDVISGSKKCPQFLHLWLDPFHETASNSQ